MRRPHRLAVLLDGTHVADVERTSSGHRLTYVGNVPLSSTPLSLSLPPARRTFHGEPVTTWLWGLLPESAAAREAIERLYGADPREPLSLLAAIGLDCAGAVQLCLPEHVADVADRAGELESASDAAIEARLADLELSDDRSWTMPAEHWSLGGTQAKFTLSRHDDAWFFPHGSAPSTHIVKPGVRGLHAQALIEHVSMRAARSLGLHAAPSEFLDFKSQRAIVVERFDRASTSNRVRRLHAEDLCQALGSREKYEEYGGPGAAAVVELLRAQSSTRAAERFSIAAFVDLLIFSTLIGAPDAHARNYSVMLDDDHVTLAQGYDIAAGFAYTGGRRVVSMSIGGELALDAIDLDAFRRTAVELDLDADQTSARVQVLARAIPGAFEAALAPIDDWDGSVTALRERLLPDLARHCARFAT